jgi:hypothetical protein
MKVVLGLILGLLLVTGAEAATYRGKVHSFYTQGTLQYRTVLYPTSVPGTWAGNARCRSLTPGVYCLARYTSVAVAFGPGGFSATLGGGLCRAAGTGNPYNGGLSGTYWCANGDRGSFYWRRLR